METDEFEIHRLRNELDEIRARLDELRSGDYRTLLADLFDDASELREAIFRAYHSLPSNPVNKLKVEG